MNNEYEYEYDAGNEPANSHGDGAGYRGFSKYISKQESAPRLLSPGEDLQMFHDMKTEYTTELKMDSDLKKVLENIDQVDNVIIRNWDLMGEETGVLIRFQGRRNNFRSADFRFNLYQSHFARHLSSNANRLREEIDADLSTQDFYSLGKVKRYAGSTDSKSIQLVLTKLGRGDTDIICCYFIMADVIVIPLRNKWQVSTDQSHLIYTQAIDINRLAHGFQEAIENQSNLFKQQLGELNAKI